MLFVLLSPWDSWIYKCKNTKNIPLRNYKPYFYQSILTNNALNTSMQRAMYFSSLRIGQMIVSIFNNAKLGSFKLSKHYGNSRHGTPTTVLPEETDLLTKVMAPTTAFSPITRSWRATMTLFIPKYAPSQISI
jgi:hypothetical protein